MTTPIPSAQVLADILNDPGIPAEAKPEWFRNWRRDEQTRRWVVAPHRVDETNAALFWSLSAWLWERGHRVYTARLPDGGPYQAESIQTGVRSFADTPVEALAAVVRKVAASTASRGPSSSVGG